MFVIYKRGKTRKALISVGVILLLVLSQIALPQTKVKPGFNLFSLKQDVEIGQQSAVEAERQLPIVNDARAANYIDRLGQSLAAQAPGERYPYQFKIVNASDINAFALPGGPIYIQRGTVEAAQSEAELAGVVAHEISHVALRHGTNQASKAYLAQAGLSILGGVLGKGTAASIIGAVGGFGLNTLFLKYSREAETQADVIGAQIMARAGYDPLDLAHFFNTLQQESQRDPSKLERFFSDHPSPTDRSQRIEREAAMIAFKGRPREIGGFNEVRSSLMKMPKAQSLADIQQRQPTASTSKTRPRNYTSQEIKSVAPSSSKLRTYRQSNGLYEIAYPENWRAYPDNRNIGVTFVPEGGVIEDEGQVKIVYGAVINYYSSINESRDGSDRNLRGGARGQRRRSLSEATNDLVSSLRQSNPYLHVIKGSGNEARLAGRNGLTVTLIGRSPIYNRNERVTVYTRAGNDEEVFYLLFITPNEKYRDFRPTFERMLNSLAIRELAVSQ